MRVNFEVHNCVHCFVITVCECWFWHTFYIFICHSVNSFLNSDSCNILITLEISSKHIHWNYSEVECHISQLNYLAVTQESKKIKVYANLWSDDKWKELYLVQMLLLVHLYKVSQIVLKMYNVNTCMNYRYEL